MLGSVKLLEAGGLDFCCETVELDEDTADCVNDVLEVVVLDDFEELDVLLSVPLSCDELLVCCDEDETADVFCTDELDVSVFDSGILVCISFPHAVNVKIPPCKRAPLKFSFSYFCFLSRLF